MQPAQHVQRCITVRAVLPEPTSSALRRTAERPLRGQPSWQCLRLQLQPWRRRRRRRWRRQRRRRAAQGEVTLGGAVAELTVHHHSLWRGGDGHASAWAVGGHAAQGGGCVQVGCTHVSCYIRRRRTPQVVGARRLVRTRSQVTLDAGMGQSRHQRSGHEDEHAAVSVGGRRSERKPPRLENIPTTTCPQRTPVRNQISAQQEPGRLGNRSSYEAARQVGAASKERHRALRSHCTRFSDRQPRRNTALWAWLLLRGLPLVYCLPCRERVTVLCESGAALCVCLCVCVFVCVCTLE